MSSIANLQYFSQVDSLVAQYRYGQRKPAIKMETKKSTLSTRLAVLSDLKTKLKTLQSSSDTLSKTGTESAFNAFTVSSTNTAVATASATSSAVIGTHALKVTQVAKNDTLLSDRMTTAGTAIIDAEGAGTKTLRITMNGTNTDIAVELVAGDTNDAVLTKIANAVNASDADITASAVADTSTTKKLVLVSSATGSSNAISLSNVTGTLWNRIGLTAGVVSGRTVSGAATAGYAYTSAASLNAVFSVDGINLEKESNAVTDVLAGVTIDLKGTQAESDAPAILTVGVDKAAIKDKVTSFITNYNSALSYINIKTKFDAATNSREALSGDAVFSRFRYELRSTAASAVSTVQSGNPSLLSSLGITVATDGTLSFSDTAKFDELLSSGASKVEDVFNSTNGVATKLSTILGTMLNSATGQIDSATKSTNSLITNLSDQITRFDARLDKQVEKYRDDFLRLQATYYSISQQQQTISAITSYYR